MLYIAIYHTHPLSKLMPQVTDKEPEARKSARAVLCKLKEFHLLTSSLEDWQIFVEAILTKTIVLQIGRAL